MQHILSTEAAKRALQSVSLPDICTVEAVGRMLGLSPSSVRAHLRSGRLPGKKVGRRWLIPRDALLRFLSEPADNEPTRRPSRGISLRALRLVQGKERLAPKKGGRP